MNKAIELTQTQIKAYENGSTIFLFTIDTKLKMSEIGLIKDLIQFSPVQKGDKDIFVQEEFNCVGDCNFGMPCQNCGSNGQGIGIFKASQMTKEQSRYSFNECIDVRVVRVQDIEYKDLCKMRLLKKAYWQQDIQFAYNQQLKEQNINRTYEDNDYVFLVEFA